MTKTYVERWDAGCDSRPLLEEADREIERLQKREKELMDVIDSRDKALGFVELPTPVEPGVVPLTLGPLNVPAGVPQVIITCAAPASREAPTPLMGRLWPNFPQSTYRHECPHFIGFTSVADYKCPQCPTVKSAEQLNSPVVELVDTTALNAASCEFESHPGHQQRLRSLVERQPNSTRHDAGSNPAGGANLHPDQYLIISAEAAREPLAFRHWSKDSQVPYDNCHCATCSAART